MQRTFTLSDAFWAWFGDSKVVDDQGQPLILYHGTASDIHSFKGTVWGSVSSHLAHEYAAFRSMKNDGAGGNIIPVYMRITQPFDADLGLSKTVKIGEFFNAIVEQAMAQGVQMDETRRQKGLELLNTIRECAAREEAGPHFDRHDFWFEPETYFGRDGAAAIREFFALFKFDGIRMRENGTITFGAFSSQQVKSVFNSGTFSDSENISETDE